MGDLGGAEVVALLRTPDGVIWAGTTRGLARLLPGGALVRGLPCRAFRPGPSPSWRPDPRGGLLVGVTEAGLFEVDPAAAGARRVGSDEMPGKNVSSLVREAEGGGIWIATSDQGAFRWDGASAFERFGMAEGLPTRGCGPPSRTGRESSGSVRTPGSPSAGRPRSGPSGPKTASPRRRRSTAWPRRRTAPSGSARTTGDSSGAAEDGVVRVFTAKDGLPHTEVRSFCVSPSGRRDRGDLARAGADLGGPGEPVSRCRREPRGRSTRSPSSRDGALLLGSVRQGLFVLRDGKLSRAGKPVGDSVVGPSTSRPDGTVWVGGLGWGAAGLRDGGPPETLGPAEGLPSKVVTSILEDRNGGLWVATDRGLFHRSPDRRVQVLDARSGLPDSYVYWVGEDRAEYVWAGTNRGAARIAPTGEIRVFTTNDGLGADECNEDGFFCDSKGRVWITTDGLSLFEGLPAPRRPVPPLVAVSEVRVGRERLPSTGDVVLPSRHSPLTLRFAALSFLDEAATTFRYRLAGLWTRGPSQGRGSPRRPTGPRGRELRLRGDGDDRRRPFAGGPGVGPRDRVGPVVAEAAGRPRGSPRDRGRRGRLREGAGAPPRRRAHPGSRGPSGEDGGAPPVNQQLSEPRSPTP